jgi:superfamily II DNA or RNA helicase
VDDQQLIYHTSLGFKLNDNSLVIVDEADHFMLSDPLSFQSAVNGACCICFTATPDDGDLKGSEASVVK